MYLLSIVAFFPDTRFIPSPLMKHVVTGIVAPSVREQVPVHPPPPPSHRRIRPRAPRHDVAAHVACRADRSATDFFRPAADDARPLVRLDERIVNPTSHTLEIISCSKYSDSPRLRKIA